MIIVCFGNGLGNQMFQYAFYLALIEKYPNIEIKMDINYIQCSAHNGFELDKIFDVPMNIASKYESQKLANTVPGRGVLPALIRRLYRLKNMFCDQTTHIRYTDGTEFHDDVFHLDESKDYLLDSTWINEKYFYAVKEQVCHTFQFNIELNERNQRYVDDMRACQSVSLHIRRGDYVAAGFYLLTEDYYNEALSIIKEKVGDIKVYLFSDDPQWVLDNMNFITPVSIVQGNSAPNNYIDMYLMSQCKHNIIANSSFSFWGAYLNSNPEKIVIAPDSLEKNSKEAIAAEGWIKLSTK